MELAGHIDSRFASIEPVFAEVLDSQSSGGASFSVFVDGECVVDVWGGEARAGEQWSSETVSTIFSCTKGLVAVLVGQLVERGLCNPGEPVATYWREFAVISETLTVRGLLEHRAGLSATRADLSLDEVLAVQPVLETLLAQKPLWMPGVGYAYHALTFGHLVGELIRRISGLTVGQYFRHQFASPLGVDAWIGIPPTEERRVAELFGASDFSRPTPEPESGEYWDERAMTFGTAFSLDEIGKPGVGFNLPAVHQAELAGANGITNARGLATLWSSTVTTTNGVRTINDDTALMMTERRVEGPSVWGDPGPWWGRGFGVMLATPGKPESLSPRSFGHDGLGGQAGWADLDLKASIGFVSNHLLSGGTEHDRWVSLAAAVKKILHND